MLLSATLGATARTRYLNIGCSKKEALPTLVQACAVPYPAVSSRDAAGIKLQPVAGNPQYKTVHWETWDAMDDPMRIATLAAEAATQGARVLVVRNTVASAVATLKAACRSCSWLSPQMRCVTTPLYGPTSAIRGTPFWCSWPLLPCTRQNER